VEQLLGYIRRNVKIAFKSVTFHYKQYICFFVAVFVVQMFFGIITMSSDNSNDIEYMLVNKEYDYHLVLKDLNSAQYVTIINDDYTVFRNDHIHDVVRIKERDEPGAYDSKYDVYIYLLNDPKESFSLLRIRYFEELASLNKAGLKYAFSPLYDFNSNLMANTVYYVLFSTLITAVSVFLMMSLYNIRLNHFKFTYGIYTTFGAGFRKLAETSFWEMMLISCMTYIPACVCSYLVNFIIYRSTGQFFHFYPDSSLTKIFAFSFIISAASVLLPMWRLSRKTPMSLIIAEDNSNLVSSPRISVDITGTALNGKYERLTVWRFRTYILRTAVTAVVFCVMMMCGLFYSYMYSCKLEYELPQFELTFRTVSDNPERDYTFNSELRSELFEIDGISSIYAPIRKEGPDHIMVSKSDILPFTKSVTNMNDKSLKAVGNLESYIITSEDISFLERFDYSGDLMGIFESPTNIIISDSVNNARSFTYKPGDKIQVCTSANNVITAPAYLSGTNLLRWKLERLDYNYTEYTICAVLHDYPSFENVPVFMGNNAFDDELKHRNVSIYIDPSLDQVQAEEIHEQIRDWADLYGNVSVKNTHDRGLKLIEYGKQKYPVYFSVSLLILIISPLIWFFSQSLFYDKRENEFSILEAFGALHSDIKKLYIFDGIFCSVLGVVLCVILDLVGVFMIYKFANVVMPYFENVNVRYSFYIPVIPFILSIITSGICGFMSVYMPWMRYTKKASKRVSTDEFGDE